jgi:hypothetical protein
LAGQCHLQPTSVSLLNTLETWISIAQPAIDQASINNDMDLSPDYDSPADAYASYEPGCSDYPPDSDQANGALFTT